MRAQAGEPASDLAAAEPELLDLEQKSLAIDFAFGQQRAFPRSQHAHFKESSHTRSFFTWSTVSGNGSRWSNLLTTNHAKTAPPR